MQTDKLNLNKVTSGNMKTLRKCHCACVLCMSAGCVWMHYVRARERASETTVTFVGHCNPLRLSLSAFLYLYSKCQCINGFQGGIATERRRAREARSSGERSKDERVFVCLGRAV